MTTYDDRGYDDTRGAGWLFFAAAMLGLGGIWGCIAGIAAIAESKVYTDNAVFIFSDLKTWGWIVTLLGLLLIFAAFGVLSGSRWARWFGIFAGGLNAIGQLLFIQSYPLWSVTMFAVDILVIYALAVYGGRRTT